MVPIGLKLLNSASDDSHRSACASHFTTRFEPAEFQSLFAKVTNPRKGDPPNALIETYGREVRRLFDTALLSTVVFLGPQQPFPHCPHIILILTDRIPSSSHSSRRIQTSCIESKRVHTTPPRQATNRGSKPRGVGKISGLID